MFILEIVVIVMIKIAFNLLDLEISKVKNLFAKICTDSILCHTVPLYIVKSKDATDNRNTR